MQVDDSGLIGKVASGLLPHVFCVFIQWPALHILAYDLFSCRKNPILFVVYQDQRGINEVALRKAPASQIWEGWGGQGTG
jgi:hypothetical protein